jgi:Fe-S oxidoreductase
MSIAWAVLEGKLDLTNELAERIYTCTMCRYCSARCSMDITAIIKAFREELVERGSVPPEVRDFLENTHKYGNPWKEPREKRGEWIEGKEIRQYESGDEFLYYVGCVGSYDTRGNKVAKALGEILLKSGLSFGVLGSDENCDGNEVNMLGEKGLFQLLAEKNIRKFKKLGVKKIVTLSPHSYNVMKNEYPQHGGNFEVMHYTKLLREVIGSGKLDISKGLNARVTYHDPCFLGRYNEEYDAPRDILRDIPGIELVEMERNRENSFCCGGGGGNFYTDFFGGKEYSPGRIRVREAYNTGAEILAVACPTCMTMLDDAVKVEGLEEKLTIRDISEIVKAAMEGTS